MPILPDQRHLYGDDWGVVSWAVRERAGWRCQCHGECGRSSEHLQPVDGRCRNRHGLPRWRGKPWQSPVFLSAAHLDHDPEARDLDRMRAYCEGCHLHYDREHHAATRRERREQELGLIGLFELGAGLGTRLP